MQAIILAGGPGTRLRPITYSIPKPMILINNKPFLHYQLEFLKNNGMKDIILCIGYLSEKIIKYFGDGSKMGLSITCSIENKPLGTGGAIKNAEKYINGDFLVVYGDSYLSIDYQKAISSFKSVDKIGLLVVYDNKYNTSVKNNIAIDAKGFIIEYDKETEKKNLKYVDAGVIVFKKEILDLIPKGKVSLEKEIFPKLIEKKELIAFKSKVPFYDIGTFERMEKAKKAIKSN